MSNSNTHNQNEYWKVLVLIIKEVALQEKISNASISVTAGVSRSTVGRIFKLEFCPKLDIFIAIAKAVGVNFFFETRNSPSDLNQAFEKAMGQLGRRIDVLPKN